MPSQSVERQLPLSLFLTFQSPANQLRFTFQLYYKTRLYCCINNRLHQLWLPFEQSDNCMYHQ